MNKRQGGYLCNAILISVERCPDCCEGFVVKVEMRFYSRTIDFP